METADPIKKSPREISMHGAPVHYTSLIQTILTRFGYIANWGARGLFHEIEKATRFSKYASALPSLSKQMGTSLKHTAAIVGYSLVGVALFTPCFLAYAIAALGKGRFEKKSSLIFSCFASVSPPRNNLCILSINTALQYFAPLTAGVGYPFESVESYSSRVEALVQKILQSDPDVFLGQEVDDQEARIYLATKLVEKGYNILADTGANSLANPSGLFIASKYPIENATFTPFAWKDKSDLPNKLCGKGVLSFEISIGSHKFRLINVHLDFGSSQSNQEARIKQLQKYVYPLFTINTKMVPLAFGDLNFNTLETPLGSLGFTNIKNLIEGSLTCTDAGKHLLHKKEPSKINPSADCSERIDAVLLHTNHLKQVNASISLLEVTQWKSANDLLSDHFAITTKISWE